MDGGVSSSSILIIASDLWMESTCVRLKRISISDNKDKTQDFCVHNIWTQV